MCKHNCREQFKEANLKADATRLPSTTCLEGLQQNPKKIFVSLSVILEIASENTRKIAVGIILQKCKKRECANKKITVQNQWCVSRQQELRRDRPKEKKKRKAQGRRGICAQGFDGAGDEEGAGVDEGVGGEEAAFVVWELEFFIRGVMLM